MGRIDVIVLLQLQSVVILDFW